MLHLLIFIIMKLTFILAVIASVLFGFIYARRNTGIFGKCKIATRITLITVLAASVVLCLRDAARATTEPNGFIMLLSTAVGFCALALLGYTAAAPRKVLTGHTDLFKLGIRRELGIAVNIIALALFIASLIGLYWLFGCADIAAVSIAALISVALLALLHVAGCIIAVIVCAVLIIVRAIRHLC